MKVKKPRSDRTGGGVKLRQEGGPRGAALKGDALKPIPFGLPSQSHLRVLSFEKGGPLVVSLTSHHNIRADFIRVPLNPSFSLLTGQPEVSLERTSVFRRVVPCQLPHLSLSREQLGLQLGHW